MAERGSGIGMGAGRAGGFGGASKGSFGGASRANFGGAERSAVATLSRPSFGSERTATIGPSSVRNKMSIGGFTTPRYDKGLARNPEFRASNPTGFGTNSEIKGQSPHVARRPSGIERAFPNTRMMPLPESKVSNAANGGRKGLVTQNGLRELLRQPAGSQQSREVARPPFESKRAPFDARPINPERKAQPASAELPKGFEEKATVIRRELQQIHEQQLQTAAEAYAKSRRESESKTRNANASGLSLGEPTSPAGILKQEAIIRERRRLGLPITRTIVNRAVQQGAAMDEREIDAVNSRQAAYSKRIAGYFNRQLRIVTGASVGEADTYRAKINTAQNENGSLQAAAWLEFFRERKKKRKEKGLKQSQTSVPDTKTATQPEQAGLNALPMHSYNKNSGQWDNVTQLLVHNPKNWEEVKQAVRRVTGRGKSKTHATEQQQIQPAVQTEMQIATQTNTSTNLGNIAQEALATQASVKNSVAATPEMLLKLQATEQQTQQRDEVVLFLRLNGNQSDDLPKVHDKMVNNARADTAQTVIANIPSNEEGLINGGDVASQINKARSDSLLSGLVKKYGSKFDGSLEAFIGFFAQLGSIIKGDAYRSVGEAVVRYPAVLEGNGDKKATLEQVRLVLDGKRSKEETFALAA